MRVLLNYYIDQYIRIMYSTLTRPTWRLHLARAVIGGLNYRLGHMLHCQALLHLSTHT